MFVHFLKDEEKQSIIKRSHSQKAPQKVRGHSTTTTPTMNPIGSSSRTSRNPSTTRNQAAVIPPRKQSQRIPPIPGQHSDAAGDSTTPFLYESRSVKKPKPDSDSGLFDPNSSSHYITQTEPNSRTIKTTTTPNTSSHSAIQESRKISSAISKPKQNNGAEDTTSSAEDQESDPNQDAHDKKKKKKKKIGRKLILEDPTQLQKQYSSSSTKQLLLISPYSGNLHSFLKVTDTRRRTSTSPKSRILSSKRASIVGTSSSSCSSTTTTNRVNNQSNNMQSTSEHSSNNNDNINSEINNSSITKASQKHIKLIALNPRPPLHSNNPLHPTTASASTPANDSVLQTSAEKPAGAGTGIETIMPTTRSTTMRAQPRSFSIDCAHLLKNNNRPNRLTYSTQFPFLERSNYLQQIQAMSLTSSSTQSPLKNRILGHSQHAAERTLANSSEVVKRTEPDPETIPTKKQPKSSKATTSQPVAHVPAVAGDSETKVKAVNLAGQSKQVVIKRIPRQQVDRIYNNRIIHCIDPPVSSTNGTTTVNAITNEPSKKSRKKSPTQQIKNRNGSNSTRVLSAIKDSSLSQTLALAPSADQQSAHSNLVIPAFDANEVETIKTS